MPVYRTDQGRLDGEIVKLDGGARFIQGRLLGNDDASAGGFKLCVGWIIMSSGTHGAHFSDEDFAKMCKLDEATGEYVLDVW